MKKTACLLILCLLLGKNNFSQELSLKVRITDVDTMIILVVATDKTDTLFTTNGSFQFHKKLAAPEFFTIACVRNIHSRDALRDPAKIKLLRMPDVSTNEVFFENGEAVINTTFSRFAGARILSSHHALQDKYDDFWKRFGPLVRMTRILIDSSYTPGLTEGEKKVFTMLYKHINEIEAQTAEKFVMENTGNLVGAYVLYGYCKIENHHRLDSLYRLFPPQLQSTAFLKNINDKIKNLAALRQGQPVPDFTVATLDKKMFHLADLKEKYVVLDFWGSWCGPCVNGLPKMKEYYAKYGGKVEFIGIACNDEDAAWRDAVDKYKLNWIQVFNPKKTNDLVVKYNVEAYPTKILIGRDGKLIQAFKGETEDFYKKLDSLLNPPL